MPHTMSNMPASTGRRKFLLAGAWSVPVIAAAIAAPSAAASGEPASPLVLSYSIKVINTAWEGTNAVTITNLGTSSFTGNLWFLGEPWAAPLTAAEFSLDGIVGEVITVEGEERVLYGPVAAVVPPAGAAVDIDLVWRTSPYLSVGASNASRQLQVFTTDPRISAIPVNANGGTAVHPPLLTYSVTPVVDLAKGTEQVVLYNGSNKDYVGKVLFEVAPYTYPIVSSPFYIGGMVGTRVVFEGKIIVRIVATVTIPAGGTLPAGVMWSSPAPSDNARPLTVRLDATAATLLTGLDGDLNMRMPIAA